MKRTAQCRLAPRICSTRELGIVVGGADNFYMRLERINHHAPKC